EHAGDKVVRHLFVKEIAHGVDEDHSRYPPAKRLFETFGAQRQIEAVFERVSGRTTEPFGKTLGIAVVAPRADLGTAMHRVPCCISPFDDRAVAHYISLEQNGNIASGL